MYIFVGWLIWNLLVFAVFGIDKYLAKQDLRRVPERVLMLLSFLGGGTGALSAMYTFRHKTQKTIFKIMIPITAVISLALLVTLLIV